MEAFIRQDDVNGFWMKNKEHIKPMEQRLYVPDGKAWLRWGSRYAADKNGKVKI
jgi:hypothetical protein